MSAYEERMAKGGDDRCRCRRDFVGRRSDQPSLGARSAFDALGAGPEIDRRKHGVNQDAETLAMGATDPRGFGRIDANVDG